MREKSAGSVDVVAVGRGLGLGGLMTRKMA
jgi:hypothetical protein